MLMQEARRNKDAYNRWVRSGGDATLRSYGVSSDQVEALPRLPVRQVRFLLTAAIPVEHVNLIKALPHALATPGHVFVHAGLRPGVDLQAQSRARPGEAG